MADSQKLTEEDINVIVYLLYSVVRSLKASDAARVARGREPQYTERIAARERLIAKLLED